LADFPTLLSQPEAEEFSKPHAIMFDAFSPATNPEMWTQPLFEKLFRLLDPSRPCALPTYSRSTMLRVTLLLAGFFVGVGHATGEKEETTIAANTLDLISEPLNIRWLERAMRSDSAEPLHEPPVFGLDPDRQGVCRDGDPGIAAGDLAWPGRGGVEQVLDQSQAAGRGVDPVPDGGGPAHRSSPASRRHRWLRSRLPHQPAKRASSPSPLR